MCVTVLHEPREGCAHFGLPGVVPRSRGSHGQVLRQMPRAGPRKVAKDAAAAKRLWQVSEELVSLRPLPERAPGPDPLTDRLPGSTLI